MIQLHCPLTLTPVVGFLALFAVTDCTSAQTEWRVSRTITPRRFHAAAFDELRQRVVCFGGEPFTNGLIWEWDGIAWTGRATENSPPMRKAHAMAYDAVRHRVLVFGGRSQTLLLSDTWELDGSRWSLRQPTAAPSAREEHAMAYDAARQRVVLFGGTNPSGLLSDTWEWDGSAWVNRTPASGPSSRQSAGMAYDSARGRTVLFGGADGNNVLNDTWTWDGVAWTLHNPSIRPSVRGGGRMAFDSSQQVVLLQGGRNQSTVLSDTWQWNGTTWTPRPGPNPPARGEPTLVNDSARNRVVLFGGGGNTAINAGLPLADTWEWDGATWTMRNVVPAPVARGPSVAYDSVRSRLCLFGGYFTFAVNETWEWDGSVWARRQPATSPSPRTLSPMAYDAARQRVVLFGGDSGATTFNDTWVWDGIVWSQMTPAMVPPQRSSSAMAYDAARQRVVMFGGSNYMGAPGHSDTWEWDGAAWIPRTPTVHPSIRNAHAMAYDAARQRVVLFGGAGVGSAPNTLADTWEWDGTAWLQRFPASSPPARAGHGMAFDLQRQRILLYGGGTNGPVSIDFTDTWEWDGTTWALLPSMWSPTWSPVDAPHLAYDTNLQCVLAVASGQVWLHGNLAPAKATDFGVGCPGSNGTPILTSNDPYLANPAFRLQLRAVPAGAPCALLLDSSAHFPSLLPACTMLVKPSVMLVAAADATGLAQSPSIPIPNTPALRGTIFYAQGAAVDPMGLAGGLSASAGRRFVIGD